MEEAISLRGRQWWSRQIGTRFAIALGALGITFVSLFAQPAYANHSYIRATVQFLNHSNTVSSYTSCCSDASIDGTAIALPTRDYNRFVRWCGTTNVTVTVPAGETFGIAICPGGGDWRAYLLV